MSWFYEGFIAIESMVVVSSMVAATKRGYGEFSGFVGLRFVFYHIFTVLAAVSTSLYVLIEGDFTLLGKEYSASRHALHALTLALQSPGAGSEHQPCASTSAICQSGLLWQSS